MSRATGKDHARINLDIWGDDDWLDLTPPAQHLYFVLWTSPQLSYCGTGDWAPAKIATKARGWRSEDVEQAGEELSANLFLLVDTTTAEFILRSWMKHDGLWRTPNMAVSMANARADLASRTLRGVIVHEVKKLKARAPESTSWQREAVANMLTQKAVDPTTLEPYISPLTLLTTLGLTPPPTLGLTPSATPPTTLSATLGVNPGANGAPNGGATPAPPPTSSSYLQKGYVSREPHQGANANPEPNSPYPNRCPEHCNDPDPPDCGRCADVRKADDALQRGLHEAAETQRREFLAELDNCDQCDEHGWALGDNGDPLEPAIRCAQHDWSPAHAH